MTISKLNRSILTGIVMLVMSVLVIVPAVADGAVLRNFDVTQFANSPDYWPIGITSDGQNLWYSQPSQVAGLFYITTSGQLIRSLLVSFNTDAGALAWDGTYLWVGSFGGGTSRRAVDQQPFVFQVDTSGHGSILKSLNLTSVFAADNECGIIDGLSYDPNTGTLWVSPDVGCLGCSIGFAYQITTDGQLLNKIQFPFGVSGVAVAGKNMLYAVGRCNRNFNLVNLKGEVETTFPLAQLDPRTWAESIVYDPATFAPNCALWAMQPYSPGSSNTVAGIVDHADIVAYQVACNS